MNRNTLLTLLYLSSFSSFAGDSDAGLSKATACAACHGQSGVSSNPEWPNLAGQQEHYLKKQIIDFRDGSRRNALMSPMVKDLSDEDAADLAAYYSSLK